MKDLLQDYYIYFNISAYFGGNEEAYAGIEKHLINLLEDFSPDERVEFESTLQGRTRNPDAYLDAIVDVLDRL